MRIFLLLVLLVGLLVACLWEISSEPYRLTLIPVIPVLAGAVVVACLDPDSYAGAAAQGAVGSAAGSVLLLLVGFKGLIILVLVMALPLTAGCGAVGGLVCRWYRKRFASGATAVRPCRWVRWATTWGLSRRCIRW
jgi:hypothetical protein